MASSLGSASRSSPSSSSENREVEGLQELELPRLLLVTTSSSISSSSSSSLRCEYCGCRGSAQSNAPTDSKAEDEAKASSSTKDSLSTRRAINVSKQHQLMYMCGRCEYSCYCSRECQRRAWIEGRKPPAKSLVSSAKKDNNNNKKKKSSILKQEQGDGMEGLPLNNIQQNWWENESISRVDNEEPSDTIRGHREECLSKAEMEQAYADSFLSRELDAEEQAKLDKQKADNKLMFCDGCSDVMPTYLFCFRDAPMIRSSNDPNVPIHLCKACQTTMALLKQEMIERDAEGLRTDDLPSADQPQQQLQQQQQQQRPQQQPVALLANHSTDPVPEVSESSNAEDDFRPF